jgi:hypothetical protein
MAVRRTTTTTLYWALRMVVDLSSLAYEGLRISDKRNGCLSSSLVYRLMTVNLGRVTFFSFAIVCNSS